MSKQKWNFRDVSLGLKKLRAFLLGREHTQHGRFPPIVASRTIPPPDIPRGPEIKYSEQYYHQRNAMSSVLPPVVAPVAEGPPLNQDPTKKSQPGGIRPDTKLPLRALFEGPNITGRREHVDWEIIAHSHSRGKVCFNCAPSPGSPWWWDGHFYYECVPDTCPPCSQSSPNENISTSPPTDKC